MKEAIGTSQVFMIMMVFIGVMIALVIGSIAYSKGFRVRNRIIDIIVRHDGYNEAARREIEENLKAIGYRITPRDCRARQGVGGNEVDVENISQSEFNYCIYRFSTQRGDYYGVLVFIHFDIPLIGRFIRIPLYGETRILFNEGIVW